MLNKSIVFSVLVIFAMVLAGCSSSSDTTPVTTQTYVGAGSVWDVAINSDGTYSIEHKLTAADPVDMTIFGTYTMLPSGVLSLVVDSTTGSGPVGQQPSAGDTSYAFEIPGYAFFLAPLVATNDQVTPMVVSGTCPTTLNLNWIATTSSLNPALTTSEFFGTATYDSVAQTLDAPMPYNLANFAATGSANFQTNVTCSNGVIHFPHQITNGLPAGDPAATGNPDVYYYVSATAGGVVHSDFSSVPAARPPGGVDSIFFALPVEVGTALPALAGVYSGIVFDDSNAVGSKTFFAKVTCDALGQCIGVEIDPETDAEIAGSGVLIGLTASNNPVDGFFTGTIDGYDTATTTLAGTPGNMACAVDSDANGSGKTVISCVAQTPDGTGANMFNVFLTQR